MYTGWFAGAIDQIAKAQGFDVQTVAVQTQSAAEDGCDFGLFEVSPK